MDQNLVYVKTPAGEDVIKHRTRVVQRSLRPVLIMVDGKATVAELAAKVGNAQLVEDGLRELEKGGFVALVQQAPSDVQQEEAVAQEIEAELPDISISASELVQPAAIEPESAAEEDAPKSVADDGAPSVPPEIPEEPPAKPPVLEPMAPVAATENRATVPPATPPKPSRPARSGPPLHKVVAVALHRQASSVAQGLRAAMSRMSASRSKPVRPAEIEISKPRRFRPMIAVWGLLGLLVLSCLGVIFYPYNNFKPDIEAALTASLRAPVRVENVAVALFPRPALVLQKVEIGGRGEAHIDEIRVPSPSSLIGKGPRTIPVVEIAGIAMPADGFGLLLGAGRDPAASLVVGRANFRRMALRMNDLPLPHLEGEVSFTAEGKVEKVHLQTEDRTLRIDAVPAARGIQLNIEAYGWSPVDGGSYTFESMQAKGLLVPGRLALEDIDTIFLGGVMKGSWQLDWSKGMAMSGEATLNRLNARRVADAFAPGLKVDGELSGVLKLRGTGRDWQGMWANANASLDADIARGAVTGVDFGEAARRGAGRNARGGITRFDRLRGAVMIDPQQVAGRDIRLEGGLVSASGRFVADRERRVDGVFDVSIGGSVSSIRMPIKISGTLPDLVTAAGR